MISNEIINLITGKLIQTYKPRALYIFGSHAWGDPQSSSDLDILILLNSSTEKLCIRPRAGYRALRGIKVSKDILVYTIEEFNAMANDPSSLCHMIKTRGIKLYEAA